MEDRLAAASDAPADDRVRDFLDAVARSHSGVEVVHTPPSGFASTADLPIEIEIRGPDAAMVREMAVRYRPMNHALPFATAPMERAASRATVRIAAAQLDERYPLAYWLVLRDRQGDAWRFPDLGGDLSAQPYFVVRPERSGTQPPARTTA